MNSVNHVTFKNDFISFFSTPARYLSQNNKARLGETGKNAVFCDSPPLKNIKSLNLITYNAGVPVTKTTSITVFTNDRNKKHFHVMTGGDIGVLILLPPSKCTSDFNSVCIYCVGTENYHNKEIKCNCHTCSDKTLSVNIDACVI